MSRAEGEAQSPAPPTSRPHTARLASPEPGPPPPPTVRRRGLHAAPPGREARTPAPACVWSRPQVRLPRLTFTPTPPRPPSARPKMAAPVCGVWLRPLVSGRHGRGRRLEAGSGEP